MNKLKRFLIKHILPALLCFVIISQEIALNSLPVYADDTDTGFGVMTIIATNIAIGLVSMIVGILVSVFLTYLVYGFGELIDNTKK